jgi:hypothetical protein
MPFADTASIVSETQDVSGCPSTPHAGDRFGIPNPRKSGLVIGADLQRFGPSCVLLNACHKAERRGGIVLAANGGPRAQRLCHPEEALYLPTFSHLFDCQ